MANGGGSALLWFIRVRLARLVLLRDFTRVRAPIDVFKENRQAELDLFLAKLKNNDSELDSSLAKKLVKEVM